MTNSSSILDVENLSVSFGGIKALEGVNLSVREGSVTALIGPNGAGKTTVFNCLTGFYKASGGDIFFNGKKGRVRINTILGEDFKLSDFVSPVKLLTTFYYKLFGGSYLVARSGVARTFQNIRLFKEMTVLENLLVAQHESVSKNIFTGVLGTKSFKEKERKALENCYHWLKVVGISEFDNRLAGELSYGVQRRLEIARSLCIGPKIICLDEPAAGLNPQETADLSDLILRLRNEFGFTVFVIEHDMSMVMKISDDIVVLDHGVVISTGTPEEIKNDPKVLAAYLGTDED
ncbi:ATP-binding cassette domain-containing protein [bacterium]|nr:ATP-binding cassette domain-containing protein [bacterium]